jgi:hypothetical protein
VIDIDGTICTIEKNYSLAKPIKDRIEKINKLYESGHIIVLFTARGMNTFNGNYNRAYEEFYKFTIDQLNAWGIKFHQLILGKPSGDYYIDDKGINANDYF